MASNNIFIFMPPRYRSFLSFSGNFLLFLPAKVLLYKIWWFTGSHKRVWRRARWSELERTLNTKAFGFLKEIVWKSAQTFLLPKSHVNALQSKEFSNSIMPDTSWNSCINSQELKITLLLRRVSIAWYLSKSNYAARMVFDVYLILFCPFWCP